jgi:WD40 repeat protein
MYIAGTLSPAKEPNWVAYRMGGVELADLYTGKRVQLLQPSPQRVFDLAPSPDGRYLISVNDRQVAFIYRIADDPAKTDPQPLLYVFLSHNDWIMWTKEGGMPTTCVLPQKTQGFLAPRNTTNQDV